MAANEDCSAGYCWPFDGSCRTPEPDLSINLFIILFFFRAAAGRNEPGNVVTNRDLPAASVFLQRPQRQGRFRRCCVAIVLEDWCEVLMGLGSLEVQVKTV